jgi:hypothetical protein
MTNVGLASGLSPGTWKRWKPKLICVGGTNPVLDDFGSSTTNIGKYMRLPNGRVHAQVQLDFGQNATIGSGGPYAISLPFPAHRLTAPGTNCPVPLGDGMCYLNFNPGTDPNPSTDVVPTLLDPTPNVDDADYWMQAYAKEILDWGTGAFAGSAASVVVNHKVGFAFNPEDVEVVFIASTANAWWPVWISNITSTQFTINTRNGNVGTPGPGFSYKIRATPPAGAAGALIAPNVPYAWSRFTMFGPFGHFFFNLRYRSRR